MLKIGDISLFPTVFCYWVYWGIVYKEQNFFFLKISKHQRNKKWVRVLAFCLTPHSYPFPQVLVTIVFFCSAYSQLYQNAYKLNYLIILILKSLIKFNLRFFHLVVLLILDYIFWRGVLDLCNIEQKILCFPIPPPCTISLESTVAHYYSG